MELIVEKCMYVCMYVCLYVEMIVYVSNLHKLATEKVVKLRTYAYCNKNMETKCLELLFFADVLVYLSLEKYIQETKNRLKNLSRN